MVPVPQRAAAALLGTAAVAAAAVYGGGSSHSAAAHAAPASAKGGKKRSKAPAGKCDPERELLRAQRTVFLSGEVDNAQARKVCTALLHLSALDPAAPIHLVINSGGGSVTAGMAIYDLMKLCPAPVHTLCAGRCSSMAAVLLAGGERGERRALPSARVMLHEASRSAKTKMKTSDFDLAADELRAKNELTLGALAADCGFAGGARDLLAAHELRRDLYLSAAEARAFGVVDAVADADAVAALLFGADAGADASAVAGAGQQQQQQQQEEEDAE